MSWGGGMKQVCLSPEFCYGLTLFLERTYLDVEAVDEL